nr:YeeE/YedE family protein [Noviherbaspirillum sp. L7-7A]
MLSGLVFGIGLILSGMTNPAKVIGFLDLAGNWDPSLALVMAGAIAAAFLPFRLAGRRSGVLLGGPMRLPAATRIDRRLALGSLAFGAGWGLAGYCPGPSLALLLSGGIRPLVFVLATLVGMALFELLEWRPQDDQQKAAQRQARLAGTDPVHRGP